MCSEQFDNARSLRKHIKSHINQCPHCSRAFESLLVLSNHVNKEHVDALQGDQKKCPFCDAAFDTFNELSIHCKEHRSFPCDICYTGFVSEPLLVEHRFNDHPQGRPAWSAPRADPKITITMEVDPDLEKVIKVIHTPDPDPFIDKWHPAIGHVKKDDKHKIECEVCHRYLKRLLYGWNMLRPSIQLYFMIVYFAPVLYSTHSGICFLIARKTILYVINVTVHTPTRTHSRSTWSPNIQNSQHKQVWRKVHVEVLFVIDVACTVVQLLHLRFMLLLIKRHRVHSVHRNSTMLPAGTSMST